MEITIDLIASVFKNTKDGLKIKAIKKAVTDLWLQEQNPEGQMEMFLDEGTQAQIADIEQQVERLIKEDKKLESESVLRYTNGLYRKRPKRIVVDDPDGKPSAVYIGTAGEAAVMSELMFHGYNANRMMIDDSIDIIAAKNNIYTYIQVKTTYVEGGRIYVQINQTRYDMHIESQLRYIIVARYNDHGKDRNMFFVFDNRDIDKGVHGGYIKKGENTISIKIKFHELSGKPFLYDIKESDASYHLNNFRLI